MGSGNVPASSRLSSLTLEATDALLPPLRSHGQQLGELKKHSGLACRWDMPEWQCEDS